MFSTNPTKRKIERAHTPEEKALIRAQYHARREIVTVMVDASAQIRRIIQGAASFDGKIPIRALEQVTGDAGDVIRNLFVDKSDPRKRRVFSEDNRALSPYADVLNRWIAWGTRQIVKAQHHTMQRYAPPDVLAWLSRRGKRVSELTLSITSGRVLAQYEAAHTWVDPNGYRLSDRIWRTGEFTRQRLDALIAEGIRDGKSAVDIANLAERFLRPDRAPFRTQKPYGTDGSFDAMRLARTEITRAVGQATLVSGSMNPYVMGFNWNVSGSHPKSDECDANMDGNPYTNMADFPDYPSHPNCLCYITTEVANIEDATAQLRAMMEDGEDFYVNPADTDGFIEQLLGFYLAALAILVETQMSS